MQHIFFYVYSNNLEIQLSETNLQDFLANCGVKKEQSRARHMILRSVNSRIVYVWSIRTGLVETRSRSCVVPPPPPFPDPPSFSVTPCLRLLPPSPSPSSLLRESRSPPDVPASGSHHERAAVTLFSSRGEERSIAVVAVVAWRREISRPRGSALSCHVPARTR